MRWMLLGVVAVTGCGAAVVAGQPCAARGEQRCTSSTAALFCESADGGLAWRPFACPGGCGGACELDGTDAGEECPPSQAGRGWCPVDGRLRVCGVSPTINPDLGRWLEADCMACRAGVPLQQTGRCVDGGLCYCQ